MVKFIIASCLKLHISSIFVIWSYIVYRFYIYCNPLESVSQGLNIMPCVNMTVSCIWSTRKLSSIIFEFRIYDTLKIAISKNQQTQPKNHFNNHDIDIEDTCSMDIDCYTLEYIPHIQLSNLTEHGYACSYSIEIFL